MPRFSDVEKEQIKARLFSEGERLFTTLGLRKVTIDDIVSAVNIAKATFYTFYDSKESLYAEVIWKNSIRANARLDDLFAYSKLEHPDFRLCLTKNDICEFMREQISLNGVGMDVDVDHRQITVENLTSGEVFTDSYDKLILATGASAFRPNITGVELDYVFFLRNVKNALPIKEFMRLQKPKTAVIAGTGFIGFELLENLMHENIDVTIVEMADKVTPNLDIDMATFLENKLLEQGVKVLKSTQIVTIEQNSVVLSDDKILSADMVIMANL